MSNPLTKKDFEAQLNQSFTLDTGESTFELRLVEVQALSESARVPDGREPFSAIFLGPLEPIFEQQTLSLGNPAFKELIVFLVPLGPDEKNQGIRYEAVFS